MKPYECLAVRLTVRTTVGESTPQCHGTMQQLGMLWDESVLCHVFKCDECKRVAAEPIEGQVNAR